MPSLHKKGTQRGRAEPAEGFSPQKGCSAWTRRAYRGLMSTKRVPSVDAQSPQRTSVHKKGTQRGRAEPAKASLHKKGTQCGRAEPTEDFCPQKGYPAWTRSVCRGPLLNFIYPLSILIIWLPEAPQSPILQQKQKSPDLRHICRRFLK